MNKKPVFVPPKETKHTVAGRQTAIALGVVVVVGIVSIAATPYLEDIFGKPATEEYTD